VLGCAPLNPTYKLQTGVKIMANNDLIKLSEKEQNALNKLVKQAGYTQEDFADLAKITLDDYKRVIGTKKDKPNGVDKFIIENLYKALEALNIDTKDIPSIHPDKWIPNKLKQYRSIFQSVIDEKTTKFKGREFVFNAFKEFIESQKKGYFTVVGDPGKGKVRSHLIILNQLLNMNVCIILIFLLIVIIGRISFSEIFVTN
jgi:hypothetical protein